LIGLAAPIEPQVLPGGVKALARQVQIAAIPTDADNVATPRTRNGSHIDAFGIVNVDHCRAVFWQHAREQARFGIEIRLECLVII